MTAVSTPGLDFLRKNPELTTQLAEGVRRQIMVEQLLTECVGQRYDERIIPYDVKKCITKHLELVDHPCTPAFFRCAMFKLAEYELARIELGKLEAKLDRLPEGAPERLNVVLDMSHHIARAYDASNVHATFRAPLGRWGYSVGGANGPPGPHIGSPVGLPPAPAVEDVQRWIDDETGRGKWITAKGMTAQMYVDAWAAARASASAIFRPAKDAWAGFAGALEAARVRADQAAADAGVERAEYLFYPAVYAAGFGNDWAKNDWYFDWDKRFVARPAGEPSGTPEATPDTYRPVTFRGGVFSGYTHETAPQTYRDFWAGVGRNGIEGTRTIRGQRTGFRYRRDDDQQVPTWFMGQEAHEQMVRDLAAHIRATEVSDLIVAGLYNWVVSTDIMVNLNMVSMATWDEIKAAYEKSGMDSSEASLGLVSSLGVYGQIIAIIMRIFLWALLKLTDPAIGGRTCIFVPFIRVPTNVDCDFETAEDAADQLNQFAWVRDSFLPQVELKTGIPVDKFRVPGPDDVTGPTGSVKKASPLFVAAALLGGAGAAYAVTK